MPSYTYNGPNESITLRGVEFPQGVSVPVDDADLEKKLDNLPFFDSDKPKEVVKPAAVSDSEKDAEISRLKREIGRLQHENTALKQVVVDLQAQDEPEPTPVEVQPEEELISEYTPGETEPTDQLVAIPEDWADMHWKTQAVLAKKICGTRPENQTDAIKIIEEELARRGG